MLLVMSLVFLCQSKSISKKKTHHKSHHKVHDKPSKKGKILLLSHDCDPFFLDFLDFSLKRVHDRIHGITPAYTLMKNVLRSAVKGLLY